MKSEKLKKIISGGEGITVEFKESRKKLNKDVYESVCSFLNRYGGHLFLGVKDNGEIVGVDKDSVEQIKKDFVTSLNNPMILSPTVYLGIEDVEIDGKVILHVNVTESSQVHRCKGKIFDRNEDGDLNVTDNTTLVSGLYVRKQSSYTENMIFPYADMDQLEDELFERVRKIVKYMRPGHPWVTMDNINILKSAGMYLKDQNTEMSS
ncbi:AlbA family DNA-binding domain-containing protein [Dethiosulfatibacter aminovorans]|nr:RNA-binding domain-containing protein [Dethiosulfatibacter aminovorans]